MHLISFSNSFGVIEILLVHDDLSIFVEFESEILDHAFFLYQSILVLLFSLLQSLLEVIRKDLCLLLLYQNFVLEVADDDLELDLTIIHDRKIIDKIINKLMHTEDFFEEVAQ